jgi:hypothetical protein
VKTTHTIQAQPRIKFRVPGLEEWARDWLDDDGYDTACQHAEEERQPDPDDAWDAQLERDWDEQIKDWEEDYDR